MSGREIAEKLGVSKSGVNDFLKAFRECGKIGYPLPDGITNYGIAECVFGISPDKPRRDQGIELPDFGRIATQMRERQNMTIVSQWNRYVRICKSNDKRFYQYRQFCDLYSQWCNGHYETFHFKAVIGEAMEVDFTGKTFEIIDKVSGEENAVVVFVAVLPYSQCRGDAVDQGASMDRGQQPCSELLRWCPRTDHLRQLQAGRYCQQGLDRT
jgi:transcriptional regulator with XRE-family HTH domain